VLISILIADDHSTLRAGLRTLLNAEQDLKVVGEAPDGPQALLLAKQLLPDVLVTDINMPGASGIQVAHELRSLLPATRILILSLYEDHSLVRQALAAGATGYVIKRAVESELINAVRAVAQGETYVDSETQRGLMGKLLSRAPVAAPASEPLTAAEQTLLGLLACGYSNQQIAGVLALDLTEVAGRRVDLCDKLGLHSRIELLRYARAEGLVDQTCRAGG
jgi:two-component system response regulator NreC